MFSTSDRALLIESKHMEPFEVQWRESNKSPHPLWNVVVSTPFRTHKTVSNTVGRTRCFFLAGCLSSKTDHFFFFFIIFHLTRKNIMLTTFSIFNAVK